MKLLHALLFAALTCAGFAQTPPSGFERDLRSTPPKVARSQPSATPSPYDALLEPAVRVKGKQIKPAFDPASAVPEEIAPEQPRDVFDEVILPPTIAPMPENKSRLFEYIVSPLLVLLALGIVWIVARIIIRNMRKDRHRTSLILCAVGIVLLVLFPPFTSRANGRTYNEGFAFMLFPPTTSTYDSASVNVSLLLTELVAAFAVTGIVFYSTRPTKL